MDYASPTLTGTAMASAMDKWPAAARLVAVAAVGHLPTATSGSLGSYTTPGDTTAKRPDHVFALFGHGVRTVCLCIESKTHARLLEKDIGPRLTLYTEALFESAPSIHRTEKASPWAIYDTSWERRDVVFASAGSYLCTSDEPFRGLPEGTSLDIQIGIAFSADAQRCTFHLRGDTGRGRALVDYVATLPNWGEFATIVVNS